MCVCVCVCVCDGVCVCVCDGVCVCIYIYIKSIWLAIGYYIAYQRK